MASDITFRELDKFSNHFKEYKDRYVLIGGSAVLLHMKEAGLPFRATKDLDLVLCVEALSKEFVVCFWEFVRLGGYKNINKSSGKRNFYRFTEPSEEGYPYMLEILSDKADIIEGGCPGNIIPMTIGDEIVSLSAILLNKDYYKFLMSLKTEMRGITLVDHRVLIPLKARAYLDYLERKERGEHVNSKDIKKHKNDIYRLTQLLPEEPLSNVPDIAKNDIEEFILRTTDNDALLRQIRIEDASMEEIKEKLRVVFCS